MTGDIGLHYVAENGSDNNDGRTWETALATLAKALTVARQGTIRIGTGRFVGNCTASHVTVRGQGRGETVIVSATPTGSALTLGDEANLEQLAIDGTHDGTIPFTGTHLEVAGTSTTVRNVGILVPDAVENRNTGMGGVGLWTHSGEGCVFDNLRIDHTQQAMLIGGANHLFTQLRGSRNFKTLAYDAASGAHTFINSKFTRSGNEGSGPSAAPVETIRIGTTQDGNGASTFICCDWEESHANNQHTIVGDRNEFIRCTTAPGSHMTIQGRHNIFRGHTILGSVVCDGVDNEFWDPRFYPGWGGIPNPLEVNGARNLVYGEFSSNAQSGVVGTGIRRLSVTN